MELATFIDRADAGEYFATGTFRSSDQPFFPSPFQAVGSFLRSGTLILFEGTYRRDRSDASQPFSFRLPLSEHAIAAEVTSAATGRLHGHFLPTAQGFELLTSDGAGTIFACHVEIDSVGELRLAGSVQREGRSLSFSAHASPGSGREILGNVVAIRQPRRA